MTKLKTALEIEKMRAAGTLAAKTLRFLSPLVKPGVSTEEINRQAHEYIVANGGWPSPLNYRGFTKSICTSINEVICHGIPSEKKVLADGDIINLDITVTLDGFMGDTSATYFVGDNVPADRRHVTEVSHECLARALAVVRHGARIGDIGYAIQRYAESMGCGVVRDFVGHGIGKVFHEEPAVPHYGEKDKGTKIVRGLTFTIEPMINGGDWRHRVLSDGWTAVTVDGKPSAQFEHTLAVVGDGIEVLTALPDDSVLKRARELGAVILWPKEDNT